MAEERDSNGVVAEGLQDQFNREAGLHSDGPSMGKVDVLTKEYVPIAPAPAKTTFDRNRASALLVRQFREKARHFKENDLNR